LKEVVRNIEAKGDCHLSIAGASLFIDSFNMLLHTLFAHASHLQPRDVVVLLFQALPYGARSLLRFFFLAGGHLP